MKERIKYFMEKSCIEVLPRNYSWVNTYTKYELQIERDQNFDLPTFSADLYFGATGARKELELNLAQLILLIEELFNISKERSDNVLSDYDTNAKAEQSRADRVNKVIEEIGIKVVEAPKNGLSLIGPQPIQVPKEVKVSWLEFICTETLHFITMSKNWCRENFGRAILFLTVTGALTLFVLTLYTVYRTTSMILDSYN